jgi:hypothetical protein
MENIALQPPIENMTADNPVGVISITYESPHVKVWVIL